MMTSQSRQIVILLTSFFIFDIAAVAQGPLASWNVSSSKQAILDFVSDVTDPNSDKFVSQR
jgi:hypothetical protein